MSGSVNGMVRSEDGQKFFTGGDDKVKIKGRIPCSKNLETIKCCGILTFLF